MIVTIDGPAGAGKSSVTRLLAARLGFQFLDTGAMYRAVTWSAVQQGLSLDDEDVLRGVALKIPLRLEEDLVLVGQQDITQAIRTPDITRQVAKVADAVAVRAELVQLQRRIASGGNFVCEGRDQGTVAFPDAFCKVFLTASPQARAQRRAEQLRGAGHFVDFDQIVRDQEKRDQKDKSRPVGRLQQADDAIVVNTDNYTLEQVASMLFEIVQNRIADIGLS